MPNPLDKAWVLLKEGYLDDEYAAAYQENLSEQQAAAMDSPGYSDYYGDSGPTPTVRELLREIADLKRQLYEAQMEARRNRQQYWDLYDAGSK